MELRDSFLTTTASILIFTLLAMVFYGRFLLVGQGGAVVLVRSSVCVYCGQRRCGVCEWSSGGVAFHCGFWYKRVRASKSLWSFKLKGEKEDARLSKQLRFSALASTAAARGGGTYLDSLRGVWSGSWFPTNMFFALFLLFYLLTVVVSVHTIILTLDTSIFSANKKIKIKLFLRISLILLIV